MKLVPLFKLGGMAAITLCISAAPSASAPTSATAPSTPTESSPALSTVANTPAPSAAAASASTMPPLTPPNAPRIDEVTWAAPVGQSANWEPKGRDWQNAELLRPTRATGERSRQCQLKRVRHWLQIACERLPAAAITQLGGSAEHTRRVIGAEGADRLPGGGSVRLGLSPGERRVFTLWTFGPGYDGPLTVVPAVEVQAAWWVGQSAPTLILSDALYEPVPTGRNPQ